MNYLEYILVYCLIVFSLAQIVELIRYFIIPQGYLTIDNYKVDRDYFENKKLSRYLFQIRQYHDTVYPIKNVESFWNAVLLRIIFSSFITIVLIFTYSTEINSLTKEFYINDKKLLISLLVILSAISIVEFSIVTIIVRYTQAKRTNYYNSVYYKGLLMSKWFKEKNGINTYAVLPIGYTNIHLSHERSSKSITRISLNRDKNIAELYSGNKRRLKTRYFNLKEIENTEFLDKFINDLTYVEGKVNLKSLFNDIYFSDKTSIEIKDYMIGLDNKI